ncbi:Wadjet anti-phage system protein JetD domain-containing protein [Nonomuraea sp. NPDC049646]|uniref:Wadjet anti-phage system protein JetD domain-containing protein n=1 Tax=unclassified Nonomuraea TaxID=2593643 RepID=UPI0037BBD699
MAETPENLLPRRERELAAGLRQWATDRGLGKGSKTRIPIQDVFDIFRRINNRNPDDVYEPEVLAHLLQQLELHHIIKSLRELTPEKIPLPVGIWLLPKPVSQPSPTPMPPWHPELSFLAPGWKTAGRRQRAAYAAINTWLKSSPDLTPLPLRERTLEIFGTHGSDDDFPVPEKALDNLKSGILFSEPSRLDRIIRTFRPPLPLLTETFPGEDESGRFHRVGGGDMLLVIENSTTWWSIVDSLPPIHRLGYVAWGVGNSFRASIRSIAAKHRITEIRYFGDLDPSGLTIPLTASRAAIATGLPPVLPANALYDLLLRVGRPRRGTEAAINPSAAASLTSWLHSAHLQAVTALLTNGQRIAQEWANHRHLTRESAWHLDVI